MQTGKRVCKSMRKNKVRVNVGKSKVIRYSRYIYVGRTHVRLNGETLVEVDCFMLLGSQLVADGGCGTQNESGE